MNTRILKLHGCSGAGKTTAIRNLMVAADSVSEIVPHDAKGGRPEAYVLQHRDWLTPIAILGSYKNNCGGMDSYPSDAGSIIKLIEAYRKNGVHVIFEGLLLSTYYGTVGKHLEQYGDNFVMAFLDTPVEICIARILQRREANGSKNKFDPLMTVDKHTTIEKLKEKSIAAGRRVAVINHDADTTPQLTTLLRNAQ
jgi:thymidylate kinase